MNSCVGCKELFWGVSRLILSLFVGSFLKIAMKYFLFIVNCQWHNSLQDVDGLTIFFISIVRLHY